jgi:uncharacterized protein
MTTAAARGLLLLLIGTLLPKSLAAGSPDAHHRAYADSVALGHGHPSLQVPIRMSLAIEQPRARIAIILDDLGEQAWAGPRAVALPGPVACSFLPGGAFTVRHAELAHAAGKEVLLHLPLEPLNRAERHPASLTIRSHRTELEDFVWRSIASVPHVRGVNNHQGSLMTEDPLYMLWLMAAIRKHPGLYFIDSRTTHRSQGYRMARMSGLAAAQRDIFLDNTRGHAAVLEQFHRLIARALREGSAVAIGHPYPETFAVLQQELPRLMRQGIELVPPSALVLPPDEAPPVPHDSPAIRAATHATRTTGPGLPGPTSAAVR